MAVLFWAGIIVGGLAALVALSFVAYFVWSGFTGGFSPKAVELHLASPPLIGVDQAFEITVTVRNLADVERVIHSIDFDVSLLKGFIIRELEPASCRTSSAYGTTAYHFDDFKIGPRSAKQFKFFCHTVHAGDYTGTVYAYVDYKNAKSVDQLMRLVIR